MSVAVAPAIDDIGTALGLFDSQGRLSGAFFEHPLDSVRLALVDPARRKALIDALDALFESDPTLSESGPPELRAYPLVDLDPNRLDLGLRLTGDADRPTVLLVLLGRVVVNAADGIAVEVEVPLVLCDQSSVTAVTGTPAGPVRLRGVVSFDEATLGAEAIVSTGGGSFGLRLTGLVIDGSPVPPLELTSDAFDGDLTHTLTVLLNLAAAVLGAAAGGVAQDVITHLPGVLGLAPDVPVLPFDAIGRDPVALRTWFAGLCGGDAAGLRGWLTHVAGIAGLELTLPTGPPTVAEPWRLPLLDDDVQVLIEVAVDPGSDGIPVLELGLRVAVDVPLLLDASLTAAATVVRLPLGGSTAAGWFTTTRAELTVPSLATAAPLVPVTGGQNGFGLGRITVGVATTGSAVAPSVLLDAVTIDGRTYDRLDLSSAQALTSAGGQVLSDSLDDLIGTTGFADDLLTLIGLRSPSGLPTIDLGHLASDPLGALRDFQLARLQGPGWAEPLEALAHLLGVTGATAVPLAGGGWRVPVLETTIGSLGLRAATATSGEVTTLAIGLDIASALTVDDGSGTQSPALSLAADVLRLSLSSTPGGASSVGARGLDAIEFAVVTPGVVAGPLSTAGARLAGGWTAGSPGRLGFVLGDVTVSLPDPDLGTVADAADPTEPDAANEGTQLSLGDLTLPWTSDPANPLAGLGVPDDAVAELLALAIRTLADWGGPVWSPLLAALADAIPDVWADTPDPTALLGDLASLGRTVLARLIGAAVAELDLAGFVGSVLGSAADGTSAAGSGVAADPWVWLLDPAAPEVVAIGWTDAGSPPGAGDVPDANSVESADQGPGDDSAGAPDGPTTAGFAAVDPDDPQSAIAALLAVAANRDPGCAASLAGRDPAGLADGIVTLGGWVGGGDGLWTAPELDPDPAWGTLLSSAGTLAGNPFDDADATEALADVLDGWLSPTGAVLVAVAPAWWPAEGWEPLLAALAARDLAAGRDPQWSAVDLRHDPTAAVAGILPADGYLVVATGNDAAHPDQDLPLTQALTRIAAADPGGRPVVLVAVGTAVAPVAGWATSAVAAAAAGTQPIAGLAAVAAPLAVDPAAPPPPAPPDPPPFVAAEVADAVRVLDTVFGAVGAAPDSAAGLATTAQTADATGRSPADRIRPWSALIGAWREAVDETSVPTSARPVGVGRLSGDLVAAAPTATVSALAGLAAGVPRVALNTAASTSATDDDPGTHADLLDALADAVASLPVDAGPATELRAGVRSPLGLPVPAEALAATADVTIGLGRVALTGPAAGSDPVRLGLRLRVGADGPTGAGWLAPLAPASENTASGSTSTTISVRRLELDAWADLEPGGGAGADLVLVDVRVGGTVAARCRRGDPGFDDALAAAVAWIATEAGGTDAHAKALLGLLRDDLGLLDAAAAVVPAALDELLQDTAGWLSGRAADRLTQPGTLPAFAGLTRDDGAPAGTSRWTRTLDPTLGVSVDKTSTDWRVTVATLGDGIGLATDPVLGTPAHLGLTVVGSTQADTTIAWRLSTAGAAIERTATGVAVSLLDRAPVRVWPVASPAEAGSIADALLPYVPAALGAGFVSLLLAQLGVDISPAGVVALLDRPVPELIRRLVRPGQLPDLVGTVAEWLGIPLTAADTVPLVDGVIELSADGTGSGVALTAGTPAAGWSPAAGLHLAARVGIELSPDPTDPTVHPPTVLPTGSVTLTVDLPAAAQNAWTSLGIQLQLTDTNGSLGLAISVIPQPGQPIELVPTFSGIGALAGQAAQRLLPTVLNRLRDELPIGPARTDVLAVATALGIYGTGFDDGPVALEDLTPQTLIDRAPQLATTLIDLVAGLFGVQLGAQPSPLVAGSSVTVALAEGPDGIELTLGLPPGISITVSIDPRVPAAAVQVGALGLGPVTVGLGAAARLAAGDLQVAGTARIDLDLSDPLRIVPGPSLRASLSQAGDLSIVLLPLGDLRPATEASITLAPVPAITFTADAIVDFVLSWLVVPGLEALVQLVGPALDTPLGHAAAPATPPTLRSLLTGAGLLSGGHVVAPLPPPVQVLVGAAGSIASAITIEVAPGLDLHLAVDNHGIGIALTGTVPLGGDDWKPSLLVGGSDVGSNVPGQTPEGLVLTVLGRVAPGTGLANSGWDLAPAITLDGVGAALTRTGGLVQTSIVTIDDVGTWLGTSFALDPATGHLTVDPLSGGIRLGGLGLPALSGGGGSNPVAGSLLGDADRNGAPINPPLDFDVIWTGTELRIDLKGTAPGATLWIQVGRTFGPLHIDRVGLRSGEDDYTVNNTVVHTSYIGVLVDGGIAIGPLSMAVQGLGLEIPPRFATTPSTWKVDLDGLAVDFSSASITIAGGLLKADIVVDGQPAVDYRGMLQVQAFGFGATALGAYSQVKRANGTTYASLFVFAAINAPIGGPPYLFITGLAGGFGVNRDFLPPSSVDAIGGFPLIAVMGELTVPADQVLANMGPSLPPRDGAYWLAAGITFTTFELLNTRALVYFAFNPQGFEIGLLGLMRAALPTPDQALISVELGLRARYSSVDQVFSVEAQLTANSWLFSTDCRLTGGFAFVVWFARPQVVLTVGGYGPLYPAPDYFPQVPLVGFEWRFSDDIVIKGGTYFAVTPEAMMTGGSLEVSAKGGWGHGSLVRLCRRDRLVPPGPVRVPDGHPDHRQGLRVRLRPVGERLSAAAAGLGHRPRRLHVGLRLRVRDEGAPGDLLVLRRLLRQVRRQLRQAVRPPRAGRCRVGGRERRAGRYLRPPVPGPAGVRP